MSHKKSGKENSNNTDYDYLEISYLLQDREYLKDALELLAEYDGEFEIKELRSGTYYYMHRRENGRLRSIRVGRACKSLEIELEAGTQNVFFIRKTLCGINEKLAKHGYSLKSLPEEAGRIIQSAKGNMAEMIYSLAVIGGMDVSPAQTEDVIEDRSIQGLSAMDVRKILNLKSAWEFVADENTAPFETNTNVLFYIAELVNKGIYTNCARNNWDRRLFDRSILYIPSPIKSNDSDEIRNIVSKYADPAETAFRLFDFCIERNYFEGFNEIIALIFVNRFLIRSGAGLITFPADDAIEFRKLLNDWLETGNSTKLEKFMKEKCLKRQ
ncbi:MAG: hypothetical protein IKS28_04250 [Clostridia bacterium]|nr:hypothetical protein [Clostridia bacterium]